MAWIRGKPLAAVAVVAAAIVAAVLGVVGLSGGRRARSAPVPTANIKPMAKSVAVGVSPQTTLDARDYDKIQKAGADVVRIPMNWSHVQAEPGDCEPRPAHGVCNWVNLDAQIGNAAEAGARVVPILSDVPDYIYRQTNRPPLNGEARAGWEDFVDAAVRRYGPEGRVLGDRTSPTRRTRASRTRSRSGRSGTSRTASTYFYPEPNAEEVRVPGRAHRRRDPRRRSGGRGPARRDVRHRRDPASRSSCARCTRSRESRTTSTRSRCTRTRRASGEMELQIQLGAAARRTGRGTRTSASGSPSWAGAPARAITRSRSGEAGQAKLLTQGVRAARQAPATIGTSTA